MRTRSKRHLYRLPIEYAKVLEGPMVIGLLHQGERLHGMNLVKVIITLM